MIAMRLTEFLLYRAVFSYLLKWVTMFVILDLKEENKVQFGLKII
jgi:hypothetical protein